MVEYGKVIKFVCIDVLFVVLNKGAGTFFVYYLLQIKFAIDVGLLVKNNFNFYAC